MKTASLVLGLALLASPAFAGSVAITVTAAGLSYTSTTTVPDASLTALVAFSRSVYGQVVQTPAVVEVRDANGNITTPASPAVMRNMTAQEAVAAWWAGVLAGTKANLKSAATQAAAQTAVAGTADVPFGN